MTGSWKPAYCELKIGRPFGDLVTAVAGIDAA
jgi:hypothetical protein